MGVSGVGGGGYPPGPGPGGGGWGSRGGGRGVGSGGHPQRGSSKPWSWALGVGLGSLHSAGNSSRALVSRWTAAALPEGRRRALERAATRVGQGYVGVWAAQYAAVAWADVAVLPAVVDKVERSLGREVAVDGDLRGGLAPLSVVLGPARIGPAGHDGSTVSVESVTVQVDALSSLLAGALCVTVGLRRPTIEVVQNAHGDWPSSLLPPALGDPVTNADRLVAVFAAQRAAKQRIREQLQRSLREGEQGGAVGLSGSSGAAQADPAQWKGWGTRREGEDGSPGTGEGPLGGGDEDRTPPLPGSLQPTSSVGLGGMDGIDSVAFMQGRQTLRAAEMEMEGEGEGEEGRGWGEMRGKGEGEGEGEGGVEGGPVLSQHAEGGRDGTRAADAHADSAAAAARPAAAEAAKKGTGLPFVVSKLTLRNAHVTLKPSGVVPKVPLTPPASKAARAMLQRKVSSDAAAYTGERPDHVLSNVSGELRVRGVWGEAKATLTAVLSRDAGRLGEKEEEDDDDEDDEGRGGQGGARAGPGLREFRLPPSLRRLQRFLPRGDSTLGASFGYSEKTKMLDINLVARHVGCAELDMACQLIDIPLRVRDGEVRDGKLALSVDLTSPADRLAAAIKAGALPPDATTPPPTPFPLFEGAFTTHQAGFQINECPEPFRGVDGRFVMRGTRLHLMGVRGCYGGIPLDANGCLDMKPGGDGFSLASKVDTVEVNSVLDTLGAELKVPVAGFLDGTCMIHGPLDQPAFSGSARTVGSVLLDRVPFKPGGRAQYSFDMADQKMRIEGLELMPSGGGNVVGGGRLLLAPAYMQDPDAVSFRLYAEDVPADMLICQYLPEAGVPRPPTSPAWSNDDALRSAWEAAASNPMPKGTRAGLARAYTRVSGGVEDPVIDVQFSAPDSEGAFAKGVEGVARLHGDSVAVTLNNPFFALRADIWWPAADPAARFSPRVIRRCNLECDLKGFDLLAFAPEIPGGMTWTTRPQRARAFGEVGWRGGVVDGGMAASDDAPPTEKKAQDKFSGELLLHKVRVNQFRLPRRLRGTLDFDEAGYMVDTVPPAELQRVFARGDDDALPLGESPLAEAEDGVSPPPPRSKLLNMLGTKSDHFFFKMEFDKDRTVKRRWDASDPAKGLLDRIIGPDSGEMSEMPDNRLEVMLRNGPTTMVAKTGGDDVLLKLEHLKVDDLEVDLVRGFIEKLIVDVDLGTQNGVGHLDVYRPRYAALVGESLLGTFDWVDGRLELKNLQLQQAESEYVINGVYQTDTGDWAGKLDIPRGAVEELVPLLQVLSEKLGENGEGASNMLTNSMVVRQAKALGDQMAPLVSRLNLFKAMESVAGGGGVGVSDTVQSSSPSGLRPIQFAKGGQGDGVDSMLKEENYAALVASRRAAAGAAEAEPKAAAATPAPTLEQKWTEEEGLPGVQELRGKWKGALTAERKSGDKGHGISLDFDLHGKEWQWGSHGVQAAVATGSYTPTEGFTFKPLRVEMGPTVFELKGRVLGDVPQDARFSMVQLPVTLAVKLSGLTEGPLKEVGGDIFLNGSVQGTSSSPAISMLGRMVGATVGPTAVKTAEGRFTHKGGRLGFDVSMAVTAPNQVTIKGDVPLDLPLLRKPVALAGEVDESSTDSAESDAEDEQQPLKEGLASSASSEASAPSTPRSSSPAEFMDPTAIMLRKAASSKAAVDPFLKGLFKGDMAVRREGELAMEVAIRDEGMKMLVAAVDPHIPGHPWTWESGKVDIDVRVKGTFNEPQVRGAINVGKGSMKCPWLPGLTRSIFIDAKILEGNKLRVESASARLGRKNGSVRAKGSMAIFPARPGAPPNRGELRVEAEALECQALNPSGKALYAGTVDAEVTLADCLLDPEVGGAVRLSRGVFLLEEPGDPAAVERAYAKLFIKPRARALAVALEGGQGEQNRATYPFVANFGISGAVAVDGPLLHPLQVQPRGVVHLLNGEVNLLATRARLDRDHDSTVTFIPSQASDPNVDVSLVGNRWKARVEGRSSKWQDSLVINYDEGASGDGGGSSDPLSQEEAAKLLEGALGAGLVHGGSIAFKNIAANAIEQLIPKIETSGAIGQARWRFVTLPSLKGVQQDGFGGDTWDLGRAISADAEVELEVGDKMLASVKQELVVSGGPQSEAEQTRWKLLYALSNNWRLQFDAKGSDPLDNIVQLQFNTDARNVRGTAPRAAAGGDGASKPRR